MCKEMNAPVLPESRKVNATVTGSFTLGGKYNFVFDDDFIEAIQMNCREHSCLCIQSKPMTHYCCPGCRGGRYIPAEEDQIDLKSVLGDYSFSERDPARAVEQILELVIHNLPLSVYTYGKSHQTGTKAVGMMTLFFADIDSIHRFAGHIAHACEDYYYHEEYLHTVYHSSMYDMDWSPINAAHEMFSQLQVSGNRLHTRLLMGYLGGGVGSGYVGPRTQEMMEILEQNGRVETCNGVYGVYLAGENGSPHGEYRAKKAHYVPHEPIAGEVVKWSPEWIGDLLGDDDDDDYGM